MRFAVLALAASLAGCSLSAGTGSDCRNDSQCGDDVCARNGECLPRTSVQPVMVRWTVNGAAADAATCASHVNLYLQFDSSDYGDYQRFAPRCSSGSYFIDKLPRRYVQVELGFEGTTGDILPLELSAGLSSGQSTGQVQFDLVP